LKTITAKQRAWLLADGTLSRKDVAYNLDNTSDAEAEAAVKAYQVSRFKAAAKGAPPTGPAEPELEFTAQVERKYKAAQIVETGIQVLGKSGVGTGLSLQYCLCPVTCKCWSCQGFRQG
jgi:hypothetical protein